MQVEHQATHRVCRTPRSPLTVALAAYRRRASDVVGVEVRSISNLRSHRGRDGLTYWSPTINLERDPRWGRNQEAPGEDPHHTGRYAVAFLSGLQGDDPNHVQVAGVCKHFIANSLERTAMAPPPYARDALFTTRRNFDAKVSVPELVDYYVPAFRACVQGGRPAGVMCSCATADAAQTHPHADKLPATLHVPFHLLPSSASPPSLPSPPSQMSKVGLRACTRHATRGGERWRRALSHMLASRRDTVSVLQSSLA